MHELRIGNLDGVLWRCFFFSLSMFSFSLFWSLWAKSKSKSSNPYYLYMQPFERQDFLIRTILLDIQRNKGNVDAFSFSKSRIIKMNISNDSYACSSRKYTLLPPTQVSFTLRVRSFSTSMSSSGSSSTIQSANEPRLIIPALCSKKAP